MGFNITGSSVRLDFGPGTLLEGATVKASADMRIRDFLSLQRRISTMDDGSLEEWEQVYQDFASTYLKSWDLEEDGEPIPTNVDGFMSLPFKVANEILQGWMTAIAGASPNSNAASASGNTSGAESEMTEAA